MNRKKPTYHRRQTSTVFQLAVDHAFTGSYAKRFRPLDPPPPRFTCLRMQTPYERPRPFHSALSSLDSTETRRSHTNQLRHLLCKGRVQQIPSQTFRLSTNTLVHLSTTSSLGKKWRRESVEGPGKSLTACPFTNKWPFCPDVGRTYNYIT